MTTASNALAPLDFEVEIDVGGKIFEGSVTLRDPLILGEQSGRWVPCRSLRSGSDRGWIHGRIEPAILLARAISGVQADDVELRMIAALSGASWPVARFLVGTDPNPTIDQTIWISDPTETGPDSAPRSIGESP